MKITQFDPDGLPDVLGGWSTGVYSLNSNTGMIDGGLSSRNFVQLITANGSNALLRPVVNFAAGSNIILSLDAGPGNSVPSNTIRIHGSAGSSGVATITSNGSNSLTGALNLQAGTGIALGVSGQTITIVNTGASSSGGGGSAASDPIADKFGTPDTTFEFDTSSVTGLTAMGSPSTEDANTTVPGCYYVKEQSAGFAACGRYAAVSTPFTAIVLVADTSFLNDYNYVGIMCGVATPGGMLISAVRLGARSVAVLTMSSPTDGSPGTAASLANYTLAPVYLGIRAASSTDVSFYISTGGRVWTPILLNTNPGITVASVGPALMSHEATRGVSGAWDYLRIWNSAKTFPI